MPASAQATPVLTLVHLEQLRSGGVRSVIDRVIRDRNLTPVQASFLRRVDTTHVQQVIDTCLDPNMPATAAELHPRLADQVVVADAYAYAVAAVAELIGDTL